MRFGSLALLQSVLASRTGTVDDPVEIAPEVVPVEASEPSDGSPPAIFSETSGGNSMLCGLASSDAVGERAMLASQQHRYTLARSCGVLTTAVGPRR